MIGDWEREFGVPVDLLPDEHFTATLEEFSAWAEGAPLDIGSMLWSADGDPRAAVVSLSHLDEAERQFAVTLVLSKLISWMRAQAGTGELRVLVYIDEVAGLYRQRFGMPH